MSEASSPHLPPPDCILLEKLFADCFAAEFNVRLEGGATEPFYRAASDAQAAVIHYCQDYVASALHEVAHWCLAGAARRRQDDYGYWYAADGRDLEQQRLFEQVEVKPQALELLFSVACGLSFRVSVDNLALPEHDASGFLAKVQAQATAWRRGGLPPRAAIWLAALQQQFVLGKVNAKVASDQANAKVASDPANANLP